MLKSLSKILTVLSVLLMTPLTTFAGGSSMGVYETNVRDKFLTAGVNEQLLMSFTVQPWVQFAGTLTLKSLDITCIPAHGFVKAKLMHDGTEIDSTDFYLSSSPAGSQKINFGENTFTIPGDVITEFEILADIRENTGDFITACAVDNMEFYNLNSNTVYTDAYQNNEFPGINRLVYVDDPNSDNRTQDTLSFAGISTSQNLGLNTKDNLLLDLNIFSSSQPKTYLNDVFIYCSNASIIKDARLQVDSAEYPVSYMNTNGMTFTRPENSSDKRFIFANLNTVLDSDDHVELKLYGDTYDYFNYYADKVTTCNLIDSYTTTEPRTVFSDLSPDHPNFTAINELYWDGFLTGYPDGTFKPDQSMTRAEFIHLLMKGKGLSPDAAVYNNCFPDITTVDWYTGDVCYAKNMGYINGYPDGTFKAGNNINDAEALKILLETRNIPVAQQGAEEWYSPYVNKGSELQLFDTAPLEFAAGENATRGGVSDEIYRLNNLDL